MEHLERKNKLLMLLQSYAPLSNGIRSWCGVPKAVELTLASAMADGLRYGNWPWSI